MKKICAILYSIFLCTGLIFSSGCSPESSGSSGSSSSGPILPDPPETITATNATQNDQITISWSPVQNATYYKVYRTDTSDGEYSLISPDDNSITGLTYNDTSIDLDTSYYYKLTSSNLEGESILSSNYAVGLAATVIPPSEINASNGTAVDSITISWDSVSGADYYKVYRSGSPDGVYELISPDDETLTDTTFIDTVDDVNTFVDTNYYYKIIAYNSEGDESIYSGYILGYAATISPPQNVSATTQENSVMISWDSVANADYYRVYRSDPYAHVLRNAIEDRINPGHDTYTEVDVLISGDLPGTSFEDLTVPTGIHHYKVKAFNPSGESGFSIEVNGYRSVVSAREFLIEYSETIRYSQEKIALLWTDFPLGNDGPLPDDANNNTSIASVTYNSAWTGIPVISKIDATITYVNYQDFDFLLNGIQYTLIDDPLSTRSGWLTETITITGLYTGYITHHVRIIDGDPAQDFNESYYSVSLNGGAEVPVYYEEVFYPERHGLPLE